MGNHVSAARKSVLVDGLATSYLEAGQGDPVVLLHGGEFGIRQQPGGVGQDEAAYLRKASGDYSLQTRPCRTDRGQAQSRAWESPETSR